ncbi:MAG: cation:proton antiporter [Pseudomonadota bacterium]
MDQFLLTAFLFLIAGVIAVPIATRFKLGSVLGYLIAGIILAPALRALNVDVVSLQHFAEFGVVMMLFLVGLELEPKLLWEMRAKLLGLGGLQVGLSAGLVTAVAMMFGMAWQTALAVGLVLSLSSTAIVLQTLNEKGLMKTDGGQSSFAVLLFQDIAVIPMLAFLPLLALPEMADMAGHGAALSTADEAVIATEHGADHSDDHAQGHGAGHSEAHGDGHGEGHGDDHGASLSLVDGLPPWGQALVTLAAIASVIVGGSYLTRPIFRFISQAQLRELFTAAALMLVIGIALLMTLVGLSPALGTFLAGVVLANSEYRHELESDIDPFKGLLLGLFFMTVGALIDFALLSEEFFLIFGLTLLLLAIKAGVLYGLAVGFKLQGADRPLLAVALAQAGEFGFVLLSFTVANNVLPQEISDRLLLIVALSMLLTPLLFILYDRVISAFYIEEQAQEADEIDVDAKIIIAGHGRFGGIVNRMLRASGYETVVLDHSSSQLEMLRIFGFRAFYGDATRPDLLHAAGIENARMLVIAIDDKHATTELVRFVTENFPHVYVIARARDRDHVYELYAAGCRDIIRETFDSGVRTGRSALEALGMHPYEAELRSRDFVARDRHAIAQLAAVYDMNVPIHLNETYVERAKELREQSEAEMRGELRNYKARAERGWNPPTPADVEKEKSDDAAARSAETQT